MSLLVAWWPVIKNRQQQKLNIASDNRYVSTLATIYKCATKPLLKCIPTNIEEYIYDCVSISRDRIFPSSLFDIIIFVSIKNYSAAWFLDCLSSIEQGLLKVIYTTRSSQSMCKKMNVWHRDFPIYYVNYRPCM